MKRIIGLDVGTKRIGVALSDPLGYTAQALATVHRKDDEADLAAIKKIILEYDVSEVLIGLPLHMNGSEGASVKMAKDFGIMVEEQLGVPVVYRDERYSSIAAERILLEGDVSRKKRKQVIDQLAAAYVLQGYLDQHSKSVFDN